MLVVRDLSRLIAALACCALAAPTAAARDGLLLVVNREEAQLSIFKAEGTSLTLLKRLPIGEASREVCLSPDGKRAYVSAGKGNSITVADLDSFAVAGTFTPAGLEGPDGCVVSPDGKRLYVTAPRRNSLFVLSAADGKLLKEIPLPVEVPRRVIFGPDGKRLFVGGNATPAIAVVDSATDSVERTFKVGTEPRGGPAITPDGKTFLVGNIEDDTVSWVDMKTFEVRRVMGVPMSPQRIVVAKDGAFAYVLCGVGLMEPTGDRSTILFKMTLGEKRDKSVGLRLGKNGGWGLALNDTQTLAYASIYPEGVIQVVDLATLKVVSTIQAKDPNGLAFRGQ